MSEYFDVWKKYAVFSGRATRREFWMFTLVNLAIMLFLYIPMITSRDSSGDVQGIGALASLAYLVYGLAVFLPTLGVTVRRLHDTGRSGFYYFIGLIPLVGGIVLLVFLATEGDAGDNEYGPAREVDAEIFA